MVLSDIGGGGVNRGVVCRWVGGGCLSIDLCVVVLIVVSVNHLTRAMLKLLTGFVLVCSSKYISSLYVDISTSLS